jgi:DNA-binding transcriptional regulator YiaG
MIVSEIISAVKQEILRLAEKQAEAKVSKARKAAMKYRSEAAMLKRLLKQREKEIKRLKKQVPVQPEADPLQGVRYSAKSVRAQRRRLGLSTEEYGKLVGVSPLTIHHWEIGKARPRRAQLMALVAVRGITKRDALAKLAKLDR